MEFVGKRNDISFNSLHPFFSFKSMGMTNTFSLKGVSGIVTKISALEIMAVSSLKGLYQFIAAEDLAPHQSRGSYSSSDQTYDNK